MHHDEDEKNDNLCLFEPLLRLGAFTLLVDKCLLLVNQSKQSTYRIKCVIEAFVMLRLVDLSLLNVL